MDIMSRADCTFGGGRTTRNTKYTFLIEISNPVTQCASNIHADNVMRWQNIPLKQEKFADMGTMFIIYTIRFCNNIIVIAMIQMQQMSVELISRTNLEDPIFYTPVEYSRMVKLC